MMKLDKEDLKKVPTSKLKAFWHSHKDEERPSPVLAAKLRRVAQELRDRKNRMKNENLDEAPEDDMPASPDEASMALDQAKFIQYVGEEIEEYIEDGNEFPEWMQNKLSGLYEKAKDMHAVMAGKYEGVQESLCLDEASMYMVKMRDGTKHKKTMDSAAAEKMKKNPKVLSVSLIGSVAEEIEEAAYKVPKNYAAMMAKKRKKAGTSEFGSHPDKKKETKKEEVEYVNEKLKVSDGMTAWIKDFQASDAPQFKGKSDKERRDMAIAAFMSAKKESKD